MSVTTICQQRPSPSQFKPAYEVEQLALALVLKALGHDASGEAADALDRALVVAERELSRLLAGIETPLGDAEPLREPLTDSEIRVLRYLPTDLSKREIAAELYVSVNTVKTHVKHLYAKLDVTTRRQAVGRARTLGLLSYGSRTTPSARLALVA